MWEQNAWVRRSQRGCVAWHGQRRGDVMKTCLSLLLSCLTQLDRYHSCLLIALQATLSLLSHHTTADERWAAALKETFVTIDDCLPLVDSSVGQSDSEKNKLVRLWMHWSMVTPESFKLSKCNQEKIYLAVQWSRRVIQPLCSSVGNPWSWWSYANV